MGNRIFGVIKEPNEKLQLKGSFLDKKVYWSIEKPVLCFFCDKQLDCKTENICFECSNRFKEGGALI
jgi:hypothetical protein